METPHVKLNISKTGKCGPYLAPRFTPRCLVTAPGSSRTRDTTLPEGLSENVDTPSTVNGKTAPCDGDTHASGTTTATMTTTALPEHETRSAVRGADDAGTRLGSKEMKIREDVGGRGRAVAGEAGRAVAGGAGRAGSSGVDITAGDKKPPRGRDAGAKVVYSGVVYDTVGISNIPLLGVDSDILRNKEGNDGGHDVSG